MDDRGALLTGAALGATGVAAGALGAHALHGNPVWLTAAHYQEIHAVALLALAAVLRAGAEERLGRLAGWTVRLWLWGVVLFSGSLYLLVLGAPWWIGPVTPVGGVLLIAGWIVLLVAAAPKRVQ